MEYTTKDILTDPEFSKWDRSTQLAIMGKYDKDFKAKTIDEQNKFIDNYLKNDKGIFKSVVESAAKVVGRGFEQVTEPLVTGQRLLNRDEPISQIMGGGPRPATAHPPTAQRVGEGVIPQEPWQAGAIAGSMAIPGISAIGPIAKGAPALSKFMSSGKALPRVIGATAGGEMGGQVSGLQTGEGGLKGGLAQSAGEVLGKLVGVARRSAPGKATRIA